MTLWANSDSANTGAPKYKMISTANASCQTGFQNVTPGAFTGEVAIGVFAADANGIANNSGTQSGTVGWQLVRQFTGPIATLAVANDGASYANLGSAYVSNGQVNATYHVIVNSIGHVQSVVIDTFGNGFINTSTISFGLPANAIANSGAAWTIGGGTGYVNGEIVTVSNGTINATAAITTNATGGITSLAFQAPGWAGSGFGAANTTRAVVTIATAAGTNGNVTVNAIAAGAGLVLTATLGGRAGRVTYETLVAMPSITSAANTAIYKA